MNKLNNWVDVRKKQIGEATDSKITIKKLEDINCYFTVKEINAIDENFHVIVKYPELKKLDKNFKVLEYTPLDKKYNVRAYVNDKDEIFEYYIDVIDGMEIRDGVPYYNDLFLDIIYYKNKEIMKKSLQKEEIQIIDQEDLQEALDMNIITKEQYKKAHNVANQVVYEIKTGINVFVNRGISDYMQLKKQ